MKYRQKPGYWIGFMGAVAVGLLTASTQAGAGTAGPWEIDPKQSEIKFVASKFKQPFEGSFKSFKVDIAFDPDTPKASRLKVSIDTASIYTGYEKVDELLKKPEWFATKIHPVAVFEATEFNKIDKDKYTIEGTITLKGKSRNITLEADVDFEEDPGDTGRLLAHATSEITMKRLSFLVGTGAWADIAALADDVKIKMKFAASRAK